MPNACGLAGKAMCSTRKTGSFHKCTGKIVAMPWLPFSSGYELGEYENV